MIVMISLGMVFVLGLVTILCNYSVQAEKNAVLAKQIRMEYLQPARIALLEELAARRELIDAIMDEDDRTESVNKELKATQYILDQLLKEGIKPEL